MQWQLFLFSLDCIYSKILRQEFSGLIFFAPNVQNLLGRISFSSAVFVGWVTIFPTIILPCGLLISLPQPKYQENTRRPKIGQRKRNCILAGWCWQTTKIKEKKASLAWDVMPRCVRLRFPYCFEWVHIRP